MHEEPLFHLCIALCTRAGRDHQLHEPVNILQAGRLVLQLRLQAGQQQPHPGSILLLHSSVCHCLILPLLLISACGRQLLGCLGCLALDSLVSLALLVTLLVLAHCRILASEIFNLTVHVDRAVPPSLLPAAICLAPGCYGGVPLDSSAYRLP